MYIPDLSHYINLKGEIEPNVFAIGWIDDEHEFPRGKVPSILVEHILALCFKPVNPTRGFYQSPFLNPSPIGYPVELKGKKMLLGSAEIRVRAKNGRIYGAPNLIYHYIKDCHYLPPEEFLEALRDM